MHYLPNYRVSLIKFISSQISAGECDQHCNVSTPFPRKGCCEITHESI